MEKNILKVRAHDAIVGVLYLISVGVNFLHVEFCIFMDRGWGCSSSNYKPLD
jgi:hypothetical protein